MAEKWTGREPQILEPDVLGGHAYQVSFLHTFLPLVIPSQDDDVDDDDDDDEVEPQAGLLSRFCCFEKT